MTESPRVPLTRKRVVDAAMELIDADGAEALSMRKLGAALGVEAMSLYNHVANKDDLLDAVLDAALAEIQLPGAEGTWEERLRSLAEEFRRAGLRHPGVLPLFGARAIRSVEGIAPLACAYGILRGEGLEPHEALDAFMALASMVFGFMVVELGGFTEMARGGGVDYGAESFDDHPYLIELGLAFAARDSDRGFDLACDVFLSGIRDLVDGVPHLEDPTGSVPGSRLRRPTPPPARM